MKGREKETYRGARWSRRSPRSSLALEIKNQCDPTIKTHWSSHSRLVCHLGFLDAGVDVGLRQQVNELGLI